MMQFSEPFLVFMIYAALIWTALGAITLAFLFLKDRKNKNLW